jgi:hypothetical protein
MAAKSVTTKKRLMDKKNFITDKTNQYANKIVDTNYNNTKNKNPFTEAAGNVVKELGYSFNHTTGTFMNNDGQTAKNMDEAVESTKALDKNFQDQKKDDYLTSIKKDLYKMDPNKKGPQYLGIRNIIDETPKVSNPPILQNNVNGKKFPNKNNPTVNRYKAFKENKKKLLEEKRFNEGFEKDYGKKAIHQRLRVKEYQNRKAGRAPQEGFTTSEQVVAMHAQDEARKKLNAIKASAKLEIKPDYLLQREIILNDNPQPSMPSLDEWMQSRAPIKQDLGITGLDEVKNFKSTADFADLKFPKSARGIGPFISGEDD